MNLLWLLLSSVMLLTKGSAHLVNKTVAPDVLLSRETSYRDGSARKPLVEFLGILTDSSPNGVKVLAEVINLANLPAACSVHLSDCSKGFPVEKSELKPAIKENLPPITNLKQEVNNVTRIPPKRSELFMIDLQFNSGRLAEKKTCLINIFSRLNTRLAQWPISFSPNDSCICLPSSNCGCACTKEDALLTCNQGEGGEPGEIIVPDAGPLESGQPWFWETWAEALSSSASDGDEDDRIIYLNLLFASLLLLLLLLLGTCKGLCGICVYRIGRCGLARFYDNPSRVDKLYKRGKGNGDKDYEEDSKSIDPVSAFFLNVFFFLCCPFFCFHWLWYRCPKNKHGYAEENSWGRLSKNQRRDSCSPTPSGKENIRLAVKGSDTKPTPLRKTGSDDELNRDEARQIDNLMKHFGYNEEEPETEDEGGSREVQEGSESQSFSVAQTESATRTSMETGSTASQVTSSLLRLVAQKEQQEQGKARGLDPESSNPPPTLSPAPASSKVLEGMNREAFYFTTNNDWDRGQHPRRAYPIASTYGSWHRAPAIFKEDESSVLTEQL